MKTWLTSDANYLHVILLVTGWMEFSVSQL